MISLDRCNGSHSTLDDLSPRACVQNKSDYVNLNVFNMMTGKNELKSKRYLLIDKSPIIHISCKCRYKFDSRKCNINQKTNNDKCQCEFHHPAKYDLCKE